MEKFLLIDGNNLLFRSFYALPQLANFQGEISNAVFGFTNTLVKMIKTHQPKYIAVAFDKGKQTFRHKQYTEYKAQRNPTPKELLDQIPMVKDLLTKMNIKVIALDELEADDILGCLSRSYKTDNYLLSADKDLLQLINNNTRVLVPQKGGDPELLDEDALYAKYQLRPSQIVDLKALMGDASDNIPGVRKVGEKTALSLLAQYETLDGVYEHIEELKGKLKENLIEDKDVAYLSHHLATIVTDKDLGFQLEDFTYDFPWNKEVKQIFERYQFNILLNKKELFQEGVDVVETKVDVPNCVEIKDLDELKTIVTRYQDTKYLMMHMDEKISFYFGEGEVYNIGLGQDLFSYPWEMRDILEVFQTILSSSQCLLVTQDVKQFKTKIGSYNVTIGCQYFDLMLARYLINSNSKAGVDLRTLCHENGLEIEADAYAVYVLYKKYTEQLETMDLMQLYKTMELPLIDVLFEMEQNGFKLNKDRLFDTKEQLQDKISQLENKIYQLADEKFNINSPKQLGVILFEKLQLSTKNNKKRSTSVDVLNDLKGEHPIIDAILEYRLLFKLYSTYVTAFIDMLDEEDCIHTVFHQALTTTGRLSSSEPNLQNIPVRSEEGRSLRKLFVSRFEDGYIISSDYSQVELRLVAHFSKDPQLVEAYQKGLDIHTTTASQIFDVPISEVDSNLRRDAKAINFGIIYGMSGYGLSQTVGTSTAVAKDFIKKYFETYPNVKQLMDDNVAFCKEHGYVKTLFGRIRPIPEIHNSNFMLRSFGERAAMNMPLQGTASDIIKLAMIKVYQQLKQKGLRAKMIVQVHDELVIDCPKEELDIVIELLRDCMQNVVTLEVPLEVDIHYGASWYDAK